MLAEARKLYPQALDPVERLRCLLTEARVLASGGPPERAASLLESLVSKLLAEEAFYDAAIAAVDLAARLSATERDLIAWTYEVVARARIVFESTTPMVMEATSPAERRAEVRFGSMTEEADG